MKLAREHRPGRESGVALFVAVFAAFLAASLVAVVMAASLNSHRSTQVKSHSVEAQYLAEGAIEAAKRQIQASVASWMPIPPTGTVQIGGHTVDYTITPTGFTGVQTDSSGVQAIAAGFEVRSSASIQGIPANAHRILNSLAVPLFQFAVFYNDDLEILPGPNMTIRGRVHTNADMYLGSGNTLTFDTNYVHAAGNVYRSRKDNPTASPGTVRIRNFVEDPFDPGEPVAFFNMNSRSQMSAAGVSTTSGYDSRFTAGHDANGDTDYYDTGDWLPFGPGALDYWSEPNGYPVSGHTLQTQEHGATSAVPPGTSSTAMYEPTAGGTGGDYDWDAGLQQYVPVPPGTGAYQPGYYHSQADLSILTFTDGTWRAYDSAGVDVSPAVASAISIQQMYDARQANGTSTKIKVTQINLGVLATTGRFPANGLIYAANYGEGTGTSAHGVRLTNGSTLAGPLTVATPAPLYIWGNYNTVNERPASVICDALNLLSNAWNDTKTQGSLPPASNTTYNVAAVTGNTDTVGSQYNGGFENLPRFHENWSTGGRVATIKGSFVQSWSSQYATGAWAIGGDRYSAPVRNWSYNPAYNSVANLPPFTPLVVTADDIVSW